MERLKVLLGAGDEEFARGLHEQLEGLGCRVWNSVDSGAGAINQAKALGPDLVFLDIDLAGEMDGIQAARRIRTEAGIPVVLVIPDTRSIAQARTADPFAYLLKSPFEKVFAEKVSGKRTAGRRGVNDVESVHRYRHIKAQELELILEYFQSRLKLEKQLQQAQRLAAMGSFADSITHEMLDILTIIRGYTELSLKTITKDTKEEQNLKKVMSAADRGIEMMENFFNSSDR